jgi:uncharacterized protein with beta-barrel porin domain
MRDEWRLSRTDRADWGRKCGLVLAIGLALAVTAAPSPGWAARRIPRPTPPPGDPAPPPPVPDATDIAASLSARFALGDLGSNFLRRLGNQATYGFNKALGNNPAGGGASETTQDPPYRTWAEAYGASARTSPIGDFVGDKRKTWGGVAGIGARIAPGVNVGLTVDQSATAIDVPLAFQFATLDLTQVGFNASIDRGPWTWAIALVHGFGNIHTNRDTGAGYAIANYSGHVDGALSELSYYWTIEQSRIVPKIAAEYVRASNGIIQEAGGLDPVTASGASGERARMLFGAEVGHYWIFNQKILDLSAYGKFVDNFSQSLSPVTVSLGAESITVQGIAESQYGADAGASASLTLSNSWRIYANYDGKFRAASQSHQGTLGVEFKW